MENNFHKTPRYNHNRTLWRTFSISFSIQGFDHSIHIEFNLFSEGLGEKSSATYVVHSLFKDVVIRHVFFFHFKSDWYQSKSFCWWSNESSMSFDHRDDHSANWSLIFSWWQLEINSEEEPFVQNSNQSSLKIEEILSYRSCSL